MSAAAASKGKGKLDAKGADAKGADVKGAAAKGADDIDSLFEDARKRKQNAAAEQRQQRKVETAASKRPRLAVAGGLQGAHSPVALRRPVRLRHAELRQGFCLLWALPSDPK